ncbi:MAG: PD40 domain-containing protein [Anaerolineae bacterium]|nr:PD40 domain-containing protein [Anaerolineae bacterium]
MKLAIIRNPLQKIAALVLIFTPLIYAPVLAATSQTNQPSGQIAFVQYAGKNGALEKDICMVTIETDDEKCITNTSDKDEYDPAWSPGGKILAYQVADLPLGDGKTETHLYDLEQNQVTVLPTNWFIYSWSPDGTRFTATDDYSGRGFTEILAVTFGTYQVDRLTNNDVADLQPEWSPDGRKITYLSGFPDSNLMLMSADGSNQKQLTNTIKVNNEVKPVWSPDGKQIAFVVNGEPNKMDENSEIYVINSDGSNLRQLTKTGGVNLNPQWSPNGKQLVFYGYAAGAFADVSSTTSLRTEIFQINADGSDLKDLTQNTGLDYQPVWSPDGQWIAFASTQKGPGIYIMQPDGADVRMVTHQPPFSEGGLEGNNPVWRPEPITP